MVDYVREMTVKRSRMANKDRLSIFSCCCLSPHWSSGKGSTSKVADGVDSYFRCAYFSRSSHISDITTDRSEVVILPGTGIIGSSLGQVGQVSVYCDWVRLKKEFDPKLLSQRGNTYDSPEIHRLLLGRWTPPLPLPHPQKVIVITIILLFIRNDSVHAGGESRMLLRLCLHWQQLVGPGSWLGYVTFPPPSSDIIFCRSGVYSPPTMIHLVYICWRQSILLIIILVWI